MAAKTHARKLAEKIIELDNASQEYQQMILDIETEGPLASYRDSQSLKVYKGEVANLNGMAAGVWAAAEVLGLTEKLTDEVINLRHS